jgi:hypothetical protein
MYKLIRHPDKNVVNMVLKTVDNIQSFIPFDPANTDYANFKKDLVNGSDLQDADGNTMTTEEVTEFIATLP